MRNISRNRGCVWRAWTWGVVGSLQGGMAAWARENRPVAEIGQISAEELSRELPALQVIDMRGQGESDGGTSRARC